jgi:hypothetical protein
MLRQPLRQRRARHLGEDDRLVAVEDVDRTLPGFIQRLAQPRRRNVRQLQPEP